MRYLLLGLLLISTVGLHAPGRAQEANSDPKGTVTSQVPELLSSNFERDLATAKALADPDLKFRALRRMRNDIARTTEELKARLTTIRQDLEIKQRTRTALEDEKRVPTMPLDQLTKSLDRANDRAANLQKQLEGLKADGLGAGDPRSLSISNQLNQVNSEQSFLQFQISQAPSVEAAAKVRDTNIRALDDAIAKLRADEARLPAMLTRGLTDQATLDDEINDVLRTESQRNTFKTQIALAFTGLVLVVIGGFFLIAWKDESVRRAIFSGESGIQFLTLFSVVIAIILFGITGILESKELAALLGGLSGYILGRVTSK